MRSMPTAGKKRKRKLATSFLDCPSLVQVLGFPSSEFLSGQQEQDYVATPVASDVTKGIFLDRLVKEIVKPFGSKKTSGGDTLVLVNGKLEKRRENNTARKEGDSKRHPVWSQRIRMGTNQCLRELEASTVDTESPKNISLLVLARDIYPPTMLAHAPVLAKKLDLPLLMLPGKGSSELGRALGVKKTSILLFLSSTETDPSNVAVNSFVDFVVSQIPT